MQYYYSSRANLRDLYELSDLEMSSLFLDERVFFITEDYTANVYKPVKRETEDTGREDWLNDFNIEILIDHLWYDNDPDSLHYASPSPIQLAEYTPHGWFLRSLHRYKRELERHQVLAPEKGVTRENAFIWAYLLLKTKELTYFDPRADVRYNPPANLEAATTVMTKQT